jgi:sugar phosphate isomerase/epimerase
MSNLFRGSPEDVAAQFLRYRLESVQILPSFPDLRLAEAKDVTTATCRTISKPFVDAELVIAAVTAHANFVDPDGRRRRRWVKRFDALIDHCKDFGTHYLVTESGSLNPAHSWDECPQNRAPETLAQFIANLQPSVKQAERVGVTILIEGYLTHVVGTALTALKVREALGEHVAFVMDPPNYFTRSMASASKRSLRELFRDLGPLCPVAHGKDVRYVGSELSMPRAGTGTLDYKEYLELLNEFQPGCPLILEQIRPQELRETIDFIDRFFAD